MSPHSPAHAPGTGQPGDRHVQARAPENDKRPASSMRDQGSRARFHSATVRRSPGGRRGDVHLPVFQGKNDLLLRLSTRR